jgi:hypothetical protein
MVVLFCVGVISAKWGGNYKTRITAAKTENMRNVGKYVWIMKAAITE